jgi:prevent-host-death family protein
LYDVIMQWQLQDAKQRFSELVRRAEADGPQVVTRHGRDVVVVIATDDFHHLQADPPDFMGFLTAAPDLASLGIQRDSTPARITDLPNEP